MDGYYEVVYGTEPVGKAELIKQGLYCTVSCRCKIPEGKVCRLVVSWSDGWENLGIPIPEGDGLLLRKKFPAKHLGKGKLRFSLLEADADVKERLFGRPEPVTYAELKELPQKDRYAPEAGREEIREDMPFEALDLLEHAHLEEEDGKAYAVLEPPVSVSDVQLQPDGTMVGAEDVSVDGGSLDPVPDTV